MPVSETLKQKSARPLSSGLVCELKVTEPPCLLYLMLLSNRLIMTCRIWVGLPITYGPVAYGRLLSCIVMPLLDARSLHSTSVSSQSSLRLKGACSSVSLRSSIFPISRMSLISESR